MSALFTMAALLACAFVAPAAGQSANNEYEIIALDFEGNDAFGPAELTPLLQTKATPGSFSKFLHGISERLGRKNEYLNRLLLAEDVTRLRTFYKEHGFQSVRVDTALKFSPEDTTVEVLFRIAEGYRSLVDTFRYQGIVNVPLGVMQGIQSEPKIAQGEPFNKPLIEEEVKRVLQILKNGGYGRAIFLRDSSSMSYYTSSRNYSVILRFDIGKRHRFGEITVTQEQDSIREDIRETDILDQLDYKTGDVYSFENLTNSEKNLNRVGIFDRAWIDTRFPESDHPESTSVATHIRVRPRDKHELAPELLFSSDDNSNFTLGTGLGYTNRNFLGGARTFSTRLRFRTQNFKDFPDVFNANNDAVANADLTFELIQPYIFSNKVKGSWSFSAIADKQTFFINRILQNKFGTTVRFAEFTTGLFDWTLQLVTLEKNSVRLASSVDSTKPDVLRGLRDLAIQDSLQQFNSILSFTIQRDMTNDIFSPSRGFIHSLTLEESGLFPLVLSTDPRNFTQFYRASGILRWYFDLTENSRYSIFAIKLKGGFEGKYGRSHSDTTRSIPQTHRFYAGGGGSVRGWRSRELSSGTNPQFGGNVLAEASAEIRTNIFQSLKDDFWDKLWTVIFVDVGNVWPEVGDLRVDRTAVAAGFGIRYDTFFGPFRIDYGLKVFDPRATNTGKWITDRKLWSETLKEGVIHFGIGHSF